MPVTDHVGATSTGGLTADRWALLWQVFFGITLLLPTLVVVAERQSPADAAGTAGVAAAFGAWHWWMALRVLRFEGQPRMLVWFAGALLFTWLLLARDPRFIVLVYGLYPQVFWLLGKFAIPGAVALTVLAFWQHEAVALDPVSAVSLAGNVFLAVLVGVFVTTLVRQNAARKEALDNLEAARAELAEASRRAGILEERQRVARDLHDTVAQGFTGIVMQLEASEQALSADPEQAREHLRRASAGARSGLEELRRVAHALRPEALDGSSLVDAVAATTQTWSADTGIRVEPVVGAAPYRLKPVAEVALLRTLQESLANIARHAQATVVRIRLTSDAAGTTLTVEDDGVGFDASSSVEGAGLRGMAERLSAIGGELRIDAASGAGVRIVARAPAS